MATRIIPDLPILFLDTGYHFWDTLLFREKIAHEWNLNIIDLRRAPRWDSFMRQNARTLPLEDPNLCCYLNKVEPMQIALKGYRAWISGIRRDQTSLRGKARAIEWDKTNNLVKVNPLLTWTQEQVWTYIHLFELPYNILHTRGYPSIGCAPCTRPVAEGADPRSGRWVGHKKVECGIHLQEEDEKPA